MNNKEIKLNSSFVNIENKYFGGTVEILNLNKDLKDFSQAQSSGFFAITDVLLYELSKFSSKWGTLGSLDINFDSYSKFLRNYIDSKAYRCFGFINLCSVERYIVRLAKKRRIKIKTHYFSEFVSSSIFQKQIEKALIKNHPIILETGSREKLDFPKYSVIVGLENDYIYISARGSLEKIRFSRIFDYQDKNLGLLFMEIIEWIRRM